MRTPRYGQLRNDLEIEQLARQRGCTVIYPATLPLADQIALFGRARREVGPSGSGMLNTMFAPEGAHVADMESFHVTVRQRARIYASTGKVYGFAFGCFDPTDERDITLREWRMEQSVMEAGLEWLLAS